MADKRIIGWLVDQKQRVELLQQFVPRYEQTVADLDLEDYHGA